MLRIALVCCLVVATAVSAQAAPTVFTTTLSGLAEQTPNSSPGTGEVIINYDAALHTLRLQVVFSDLTAGTTAAHIHCCTATPFTGTAGVATPVPTFPGFPSGVTSGAYDQTFDMTSASSYNAAFVTAQGSIAAAEAALLAAMIAGTSYLNIHSTAFPAGEIRGFLSPVSEPAALFAMLTGLTGLLALRRRRH